MNLAIRGLSTVFAVSLIRAWAFGTKPQYSRIFPPFTSLFRDLCNKKNKIYETSIKIYQKYSTIGYIWIKKLVAQDLSELF